MTILRASSLKVLVLALFASIRTISATTVQINGNSYSPIKVISRDFSIIGGGSSGTYSAIRLGDLGNSSIVIEQIGRLGGNTQTYIDPITGDPIDYGVQVFHMFDEVFNYFARLNVSLTNTTESGFGVTTYALISPPHLTTKQRLMTV